MPQWGLLVLGKIYLINNLSNAGNGGGRSRKNIHGSPAEQMKEKKSGGRRSECCMAPKT